MGSFGGHVLPGSMFIIISLWWTVSVFIRRFTKDRNKPFISTSTFPCLCLCGRLKSWPIEAFTKFAFMVIGITVETVFGFDDNWNFVFLGNAQHITMYSCVIISGIVDLLLYFKVSLPPSTDYITLALSFMVEAMLFYFHIDGRPKLDVLVHTLLIYAVYGCIISVILEAVYRRSIITPLFRCYFTLLQGTWFVQLAFILYNPFPGPVPWKDDNHDDVMLVTLYFAWHALVDFVIVLGIGIAVRRISVGMGYMNNQAAEDKDSLVRLTFFGDTNGDFEYTQLEQDDKV